MAMFSEALPAEPAKTGEAGGLHVVPDVLELTPPEYPEIGPEVLSFEHDQIADLHPELAQEPKPHRLRRFLGKVALVGGVFLASGTAGVMTIGAPAKIGPLHGMAKITFDGYSSATLHDTQQNTNTSLGVPFKAPFPLNEVGMGVHAKLPNPLISITPDGIEPKIHDKKELEAKAALFANSDQDGRYDAWKIKEYFLLYGLSGLGGLALSAYGLTELKKHTPNKEHLVSGLRIALAAGLITACAVPITLDKVSPPHGTDISGEIAGLPPGLRVAGEMLAYVRSMRKYGDEFLQHQKLALKYLSPLFRNKDTQTVVLVEGNKCSMIMPRNEGELANELHAAFIVNAGDGAIGNSPLDDFCYSNQARQFHGHTQFYAEGQHDNKGPIPGATLLNGNVVTKDGLTIEGDDDVMKYTDHGKQPDRAETRLQMAQRLADVACKQENGVNLFVTNERSETEDVIKRGCADAVYAGDFESSYMRYNGETGQEVNAYFTEGSGGAIFIPDYQTKVDFGTAGKLKTVAEVTLMGFYDVGHGLAVTQSLFYTPSGLVIAGPAHTTALGEALLATHSSPQKQRALDGYLAALAKTR